eukprot:scaffold29777_cov33-Phaeocystis_antarctica.AAC.1
MARADTPVSRRWRRPLRPRWARDGRGAPAPTAADPTDAADPADADATSASSATSAAAAIRRRRPASEYRSWAPVSAAAVGAAASVVGVGMEG